MRLQDEVRAIVEREGVIARKQHRELAGGIDRLLRCGALVAVLPGVYASPDRAGERDVRLCALGARHPDAVLVGHTAAQLTFWPELPGGSVTAAVADVVPRRIGFELSCRSVPPELVVEVGPFRVTGPALTALDLCDEVGGDGIDQVLRTRTATLSGLQEALGLTGGRRGNGRRRALLLDSRDEPWSAAERTFHRLLREARITGWRANRPVEARGSRYYLDVAFFRLRVLVEIDGRLEHSKAAVFESDRWRQNLLVLDGWTVLRFTVAMLDDRPAEVVDLVREALAQASR